MGHILPGERALGAVLEPARPVLRPHRTAGTALERYQDLVVGSRSLPDLLRHELIACWGAAIPGAAGHLFRRLLWPGLFAGAGRGTAWGRNVALRHPNRMWIGDRVLVDDDCFFDAKGCEPGGFRIGDDAVISRGCALSAKAGPLHLGPRVNLGAGCLLSSDGGIRVGADTLIAGQCYIGGGRYDPDGPLDIPMHQRSLPGGGVEIGAGCWLGAGVVVVSGVRIGDGAVVGAGSIVTRDVPPYTIAVGSPARVIRRRARAPEPPDASAPGGVKHPAAQAEEQPA